MIWGTGSPRREFLHVDDAAKACYFLMENYEHAEIVNIGLGKDNTIAEMAKMVLRRAAGAGRRISQGPNIPKVFTLIPMNDTTVHLFMYVQVTEESDQ
jgi:nucleoside-diphosphate-sugar epimerase